MEKDTGKIPSWEKLRDSHRGAAPGIFTSMLSMLAGWVLLNQKFSGREMLGCAIMFAAIVLAQLPDLIAAARKKKGKAA